MGIDSFKEIDQQLFLVLNGLHHPLFDLLFYWISKEWIWLPLYLTIAYLFYRYFGKKSGYLVLFALLLVIATDQMASHVIKNYFQRYRPTHHLLIGPLVHVVNGYRGGLYGFVSSHAANTFGFAMFAGLVLRKSAAAVLYVLFVWAALVSYSRIYLGVHYPADVAGGAFLGCTLGWLTYSLCNLLFLKQKESIPDRQH